MASKSVFSLLGRKAAAAGVAGASVAANQPSAHAREAVHTAAAPAPVTSRTGQQVFDDDWMEPHFEGQEVLVFRSFRPDEVDQAVASVQSALDKQQHGKGTPKKQRVLAVRPALTVQEEGGDTSAAGSSAAHAATAVDPASPPAETDSSCGEAATDVLGEPLLHAGAGGTEDLASVATTSAAAADLSNTAMSDLLQISRKLLTRPGLQREVFKCMVEDAEVRELMLRQSRNIDLYLQAVGVHTPAGLLTDSPEAASTGLRYRLPASVRARIQSQEEGEDGNAAHAEEREGDHGGDDKDVLSKILDAVAACIDQTGSWLAGLGGWLRGRFLELGMLLGGAFGMGGQTPHEGTETHAEGASNRRSAGDVVLGAAMVVTVAVFCVMLARSPRLVSAMAAGTMAAAGTAASAKRQQVNMPGGGGMPRA